MRNTTSISLNEDGQHIDYSKTQNKVYHDTGLSGDLYKMISDAIEHKNLKGSISDLYSDLSNWKSSSLFTSNKVTHSV